MVFLRLTVKVQPREPPAPAWHQNGDTGVGVATANTSSGKTIAFLVPVPDPDNVSLGALGGLIQDKWKKLRPNAEPLQIRKILHEEHPDEHLDVDLSVADVFVQHGRAYADGQDQRATAVVVQKPQVHSSFIREESVVQDWESAAATSRSFSSAAASHSFRPPASTIPTIPEDELSLSRTSSHIQSDRIEKGSTRGYPNSFERGSTSYDLLMQSVERDQPADDTELPESPTWKQNFSIDDREIVESSPQLPREASEELGVSEPPKPPYAPYLEQIEEERSVKGSSSGRRGSSVSSQNLDRQQSVVKDSQTAVPVGDGSDALHERSIQHTRHEEPQQQPGKENIQAAEGFEPSQSGDIDMADTDDLAEPVPGLALARQQPVSSNIVKPPSFQEKTLKDTASKRKRQSSDQLPPSKEPRLELSTEPSTPLSRKRENLYIDETKMDDRSVSPTPSHPRRRRLSFSSPQISFDVAAKSPNKPPGSLGFGITSSPAIRRTVPSHEASSTTKTSKKHFEPVVEVKVPPSQMADTDMTPPRLEKKGTDSEAKHRSALRKDGYTDRNRARRSISFADDEPNNTSLTAKTTQQPPSKLFRSQNGEPSSAEKRDTVASKAKGSLSHSEGTPSSVNSEGKRGTPKIVWPSNVSQDIIEQYKKEYEKEAASKTSKTLKKRGETVPTQKSTGSKIVSKEPGLTPNSSSEQPVLADPGAAERTPNHALSDKPSSGNKAEKLSRNSSQNSSRSLLLDQRDAQIDGDNKHRRVVSENTFPQSSTDEDNGLPPTEKKVRQETGGIHLEKTKQMPVKVIPERVSPRPIGKTAAVRTISQMNISGEVPVDSHQQKNAVYSARTQTDQADPMHSSQSSMATKQLYSELELAHSDSPTKHEAPVPALKTRHTAHKSPASSLTSSSSESESDTDSSSSDSSDSSDSDSSGSDSSGSDSDSDSDSSSDSSSESGSQRGSVAELKGNQSASAPKEEAKSAIELTKETKSVTKPDAGVTSRPDSSAAPALNSNSGLDLRPAPPQPHSDSDSDESDEDGDDDLFGHLVGSQSATPKNSQNDILSQHTFGSSTSWTPVNTKKRHNLSSIRAHIRRDREATKAAAKPKPATGNKKTRGDLFEVPSSSESDDSDDDDDSYDDDRGDILPTGEEKSMVGRGKHSGHV